MRHVIKRVLAICRRSRFDADLAEEIDTHLELRRRALVESGLTPADAEREARRQFGNVTAIRERSRDEWGGVWLRSLLQDLRFGVRQMIASPWLSAAVIATIALGTGINGAMFFFVNEALIGRSPLPDSSSLVWIDDGKPRSGLTFPDYVSFRERAGSFEGLAAFGVNEVAARLPQENQPRAARAILASGNYFRVLRTSAALGRTFEDADDRLPAGTPVAVISDTAWARRFDRDPSVLGRSIELNLRPFTIVGVLPPGFSGPRTMDGNPYVPDVWVPISALPILMPGDTRLTDRTAWWGLQVIGRLRPDVAVAQSRAELRVIAAALDAEFPGARPPRTPWVRSVDAIDPRALAGQPGIVVGVLGTVSLGILVIACANVAGLLLARVSARRREVAVRLSLGAGRSRIIRQFLAEGLILAATGTIAGLVIARWALTIVLSSNDQALAWSFAPDSRVITFAIIATLVATVSTGWMPARQASKISLVHDLTRTSSPRVGRVRDVLIGIEVAIAVVLLVGTALLARGAIRSQTLDPGIPVDRLIALEVDAKLHGYTGKALEDVLQQVRREAAALPGVTGTTLVHPVPFSGSRLGSTLRRAERPDDPGIHIFIGEVSPEFFSVSGIPVVRGRPFAEGTDEVVINEKVAALLWPDHDPLGARITAGDFDRRPYIVVGIARDTAFLALRQRDEPFMFRSGSNGAVLVRTEGPASSLTRAAIAAAARVDGRFVPTARTLESEIDGELTAGRAIASAAAGVAILAILVALGGIAATAAQHVAHRTHEIGVRMALGAPRRSAVSLVVRRALLPVVLGTAAGLLIGSQASSVLTRQLYGVSPTDAVAFTAGALLAVVAAAVAAWLPARRAASIDPLIALRAD